MEQRRESQINFAAEFIVCENIPSIPLNFTEPSSKEVDFPLSFPPIFIPPPGFFNLKRFPSLPDRLLSLFLQSRWNLFSFFSSSPFLFAVSSPRIYTAPRLRDPEIGGFYVESISTKRNYITGERRRGERKRREVWTIWRSRIHQHFYRSREREDSPKKGREESEEGVRKRSFFQIRVAPFVKIFPDRKCLGAEKWLELVRMADPRPGTMPLPPPTRKLVVQRSARLQNIAASLAKPGDVYARGEAEEEGRGKFSVLPELLSRKSFLSHFSPPTSPRFFAPPSRFRGFRRLRETCSIPGREYDTTGIRDPARKKSTGMLFALGFLSPVFPSLSPSLSLSPFFEREERWMLASFFFSLLLLISNASR